jgi:dihydrofolate reductase
MRKIVAGMFMSLDGVVESPDRWVFPYFDDEVGGVVGDAVAATDAMLLGRRGYEEWAAYWPDVAADQDPFAPFINGVRKYVVTTTLTSADWSNSEIVSGDVRARIEEIKAQDGGTIGMSGSATTVAWLAKEGLLDELSLLVFPVLVGAGKRLFEGETEQLGLSLLGSKTFERTGVVWLRYGPATTS